MGFYGPLCAKLGECVKLLAEMCVLNQMQVIKLGAIPTGVTETKRGSN